MKKSYCLLLRSLLSLLFLTVVIPCSFGQVIQVESFESSIFPAPGWKQARVVTTATGAFVPQVGALTNPTTTAPFGSKVMIFNSATASINDSSFMFSKPFDFSNCGATNPSFSFQMYNNNSFPANLDKIEVYVNSVPSWQGATPVNHGGGVNFINRYSAVSAWNTYTFNLNAATYNGGAKKTYIILLGVAKGGGNMYLDNFRVTTHPAPALTSGISIDVFNQNPAAVGIGTTNQWIIGMRCIMSPNSGCGNIALSTAVKLDSLLLNTNGTTNLGDIQNARVWYTGGSSVFSTGYISPFPAGGYPAPNFGQTIPVPNTNLQFMPATPNCFHLEYDTTYFWLTYDVKSTAVANNQLDAEMIMATVAPGGGPCPTTVGFPGIVTVSTTTNSILGSIPIALPYCVPVNISGVTYPGAFNSQDFVQRVEFLNAIAPTYINTNVNSVALQNPNSPCFPNCPFVAHPPDYELWDAIPGQTVALTQGSAYSFRVQGGTWTTGNYVQAWIDFNYNGIFDASEKLSASAINLAANAWGIFNFTVPAAGYSGITRLRVRETFSVPNMDPCANYSYGETEDFTITILPNCPVGYHLWLGNTDDWDDPANWCAGIPGSADSAALNRYIVPGIGAGGRPYHPAVIKSGVKANTKGLSISAGDSLYVNAPVPADTALRVHGGIHINGQMSVIGGNASNFTLSNGTLENTIYTPFRGTVTDTRCQIFYSAAELTGQGLVANSKITQIGFTVMPTTAAGNPGWNSGGAPFNNFTISYGFQSGATTGFASNIPVSTGTTVFGPTAFSTVAGSNLITLSSPIVWNGTSSLVIQYCFDNFASTGNDLIKITQTTGRKTVLLLTTTTPNSGSGCNLVPGAGVSDNFFASAGANRPNFTFYTEQLYLKPLIGVKGDWENNGLFNAGNSQVILDSSKAQNISGSSTTSFHELNISKAALSNSVTMLKSITVLDTLFLTQGKLLLNKRTLNIINSNETNNPGAAAITTLSGPISRTNGLLISEDSLSKVNWTVGVAPAASFTNGVYRVVPFGTNTNAFIPFSFRHYSGDLGIFTVATYGTAAANTPWPPTVSQLNDTGVVGVNNAAAVVDRFWITTKGTPIATAATVDFAFRWASTERPTSPAFNSLSNPARAYPWRISSNNISSWLRTYTSPTTSGSALAISPGLNHIYGVNGATFDSVRVSGFNWPVVLAGGAPWNATSGPMPLTLPWAIAGSNATGALGNGSTSVQLMVILDSVHAACATANGEIYTSVIGGNPPYSYQWSNGAVTADITGLSAGNYTIIVTDANGATASIIVAVISGPAIPGTPGTMSGPNRVCPGSTGIVYSIPVVAGAAFYQWTIPVGMTPTSPVTGNSITVNIAAGYVSGNVEVRAGNSCGYGPSRMKTVRTIIPVTPGTVTGPAYGVCNAAYGYSIVAVNQATTYLWTAPPGASIVNGQGTTSVTVSFTSTFAIDTLRVRAGNSCAYGPERKFVVRGKPQAPGAITGPSTACNGQTGVLFSITPVFGATSYTWNKPTGSTITNGQGTATATIKFGPNSGNVTVKAVNGCGISGNSVKAVTINCRETSARTEFTISPNPSGSNFKLEGDFSSLHVRVLLFDMTGKEIRTWNATEEFEFGADLPAGVYLLHIEEGDFIRNERIVKM